MIVSVFKFLLAGLPGFALAVPLNIILVETAGIAKWVAYPVVLFFQVNVGFAICRWKVFTPSETKPIGVQYAEFMSAVVVFRAFDAILYAFCVSAFPFTLKIGERNCYYIVYQLANVIVFSFAKFVFCRRAIEGKSR